MGVRSTNSTQSFFDEFFRSGTDAVSAAPSLVSGPISATGGDSTLTITGYKVHIYTSTGPATLNVSSGGGEVEYLVVAGGGSGAGVTASNPVFPNLYPKLANALPRDFMPIIRHRCRR